MFSGKGILDKEYHLGRNHSLVPSDIAGEFKFFFSNFELITAQSVPA